nr:hypothetical protein [Tanacetum cinerariifolium]
MEPKSLTLLGDGIKSARIGDKAPDTGGNAVADVKGDLRLLRDGPAEVLVSNQEMLAYSQGMVYDRCLCGYHYSISLSGRWSGHWCGVGNSSRDSTEQDHSSSRCPHAILE